jgi:methylenetetrahydrofolate dehydrogenase (NADP+)/methenyltetrahydrofolate cyclohydrolase
MTEILRGTILAENIKKKLADRLANSENIPGLGVILAGDDEASKLYVNLKEQSAKQIGIYVEKAVYDNSVTTEDLKRKVKEFNDRNDIHGILIQLPLPENVDSQAVIDAMHPDKDIDGFLPENIKRLENGEVGMVSPVALSVMRLIQSTMQPLRGKNAVILSNSEIFSKPIIALMKESGINGTYLNPQASALESKMRAADIVVVAVGKPGFIKSSFVAPHAILIDVGTTKVGNSVKGDATSKARDAAAFSTPVPGGVGPLTVAYLMNNIIKAFEIQKTNSR